MTSFPVFLQRNPYLSGGFKIIIFVMNEFAFYTKEGAELIFMK